MQDLFNTIAMAIGDDSINLDNLNILELFGKKNIEEIQEKIAKATGLGVVTVNFKGEYITDPVAYCDFCKMIGEDEERNKLCYASSAFGVVQAAVHQKNYIYCCPCGLMEVAIPLIVRGQFLGGFLAGQIRCTDAPKDTSELKNVMPHKQDYTQCEPFKSCYERVKTMTYDEFYNIAELISLIVNQLGEKEMVNIMLKMYQEEQQKRQEEIEKRTALEQDLREAELFAFRSKMNPYFVFTTLSAISNLAVLEEAPQTNEVISVFADFLRDKLTDPKELEFIVDEVETIEKYLFIQKMRFSGKLDYQIELPQDLALVEIPSMMLFPFVERAVYYGIACKESDGRVSIRVSAEGDDLLVSIADDGPGLNRQEIKKLFGEYKDKYEGYHVDNEVHTAQKRFGEYFGQGYKPVIKATKGVGTCCTLRFPKAYGEMDG